MASLNKVFLMGNLTRDPELKHVGGGTPLCVFGLAVNRRYTTSQGEEREDTCFVDVEVWGRQAEACGNYLSKGAPALLEGRLQYDSWEDRETGRKRSKLLIRADRVQFLGAPSRGSGAFSQPDDRRQPPPRRGPAPDSPSAPPPSSGSDRDEPPSMPPFEPVGDDVDDDIPF